MPPEAKATARAMVAEVLLDQPAWVRVNAARTAWCEADLAAIAGRAVGIRIPKVESASDVEWVAARAPETPIICAIESARGVLAAQEIAAAPGVRFLAMGGVDLQRDLNTSGGNLPTLYARSHLVLASRAAGSSRPSTACSRCSVTMMVFVIRRSSLGRWVSSASRRSTRVSWRRCTRCSPPPSSRSLGHARCWRGSTRRMAVGSRCRRESSSTCPSPTGLVGCWRSRRPRG